MHIPYFSKYPGLHRHSGGISLFSAILQELQFSLLSEQVIHFYEQTVFLNIIKISKITY